MSDAQYRQYENIHEFANNWRKFQGVSAKKDLDAFKKEMQRNTYSLVECKTSTGKPVSIYLFSPTSKFAAKSPELKKLLSRLNRSPQMIILITEKVFSTHSKRAVALQEYAHLDIKCYLHENFKTIIPLGPNCYEHKIMTSQEVKDLLKEHMRTYLVSLAKINTTDPQCIWLGAEIGDVIKITQYSTTAMKFLGYRVVVPPDARTASIQNYKKRKNNIKTDDSDDEKDDVDLRRDEINDEDFMPDDFDQDD